MGKSKGGRPKLQLCYDDIKNLASIGNSQEDIAYILKCSVDTLSRRYADALKEGSSELRKSIKKTQIDVAVKDRNTTMLIWCGKQWCGQRDGRLQVQHEGSVIVNVKNFGDKKAKKWVSSNENKD